MLGSQQPAEGVVRINGKALEQSQLRKYDKNEKYLVIGLAQTNKGKTPQAQPRYGTLYGESLALN